jgi:hypothetical protein
MTNGMTDRLRGADGASATSAGPTGDAISDGKSW